MVKRCFLADKAIGIILLLTPVYSINMTGLCACKPVLLLIVQVVLNKMSVMLLLCFIFQSAV